MFGLAAVCQSGFALGQLVGFQFACLFADQQKVAVIGHQDLPIALQVFCHLFGLRDLGDFGFRAFRFQHAAFGRLVNEGIGFIETLPGNE